MKWDGQQSLAQGNNSVLHPRTLGASRALNGYSRSETEDVQLLRRPLQPLLRPEEEIPDERRRQQAVRFEHEVTFDFTLTDYWRVLRITSDIIQGFDALAHIPPSVAFFGSARLQPSDPVYRAAEETAQLVARAGFGILTGGGSGIMEAANKGSQLEGSLSIGCVIQRPFGVMSNQYLDIEVDTRYFCVGKTLLLKYANAFIIFPGGFGTLYTVFDVLMLLQAKKVGNAPLILYGINFWNGLLHWIRETMLQQGIISPEDLELIHISNDPEEICQIVCVAYKQNAVQEKEEED